jgi:hypothetical protein
MEVVECSFFWNALYFFLLYVSGMMEKKQKKLEQIFTHNKPYTHHIYLQTLDSVLKLHSTTLVPTLFDSKVPNYYYYYFVS